MAIDFKRKSTKSHETVHTVQTTPREIHNKEKKENIPPKMMTLQPNSVLFFNLFYLIVLHLSFLGGEVITTHCITTAARNPNCNQDPSVLKTTVERDSFTKNVLENVNCVTRNQMP